ncbi:MAG: DUF4893 domain-containing protein [Pseudomonadota bacterium]
MADSVDVFISYKREERALSSRVSRALSDIGFVTVSDVNLARNEHFGDAIDKMIRRARLVVVLWTARSAASRWVRMEARLPRDLDRDPEKRTSYLGVLLEVAELPVDLRGLQMLDLSAAGLDEDGLSQLAAAVRDVLGAPAGSARADARARSASLSEEFQLYDIACQIGAADGFDRYLAAFPNGAFAKDARAQSAAARRWWVRPISRSKRTFTISVVTTTVAVATLAFNVASGGASGGGAAAPEAETDQAAPAASTDELQAARERIERLVATVGALTKERDAALAAEAAAATDAAESAAAAKRLREERDNAVASAESAAEAEAETAARLEALEAEAERLRAAMAEAAANPRTPGTPPPTAISPADGDDRAAAEAEAVAGALEDRFGAPFVAPKDAVRLSSHASIVKEALSRAYDETTDVGALRTLLQRRLRPLTSDFLLGDWRCRSIQQGGEAVFAYRYFDCRVSAAPNGGLFFEKLTGSQRTSGVLYEASGTELALYLGGSTVNEDPQVAYAPGGEANEAGWAVRDGERSWQLRILFARNMEILELNR